MNASSHDIKVLHHLVEDLSHCAAAYTEASNTIVDARYRQWLDRRASDRLCLAEELKKEMRLRGSAPADKVSMLAKAQRAFSGFAHAVLGNQKPMLETLKQAEATLKERFDSAISDSQISATTRETLRRGLIRFGEAESDLDALASQLGPMDATA